MATAGVMTLMSRQIAELTREVSRLAGGPPAAAEPARAGEALESVRADLRDLRGLVDEHRASLASVLKKERSITEAVLMQKLDAAISNRVDAALAGKLDAAVARVIDAVLAQRVDALVARHMDTAYASAAPVAAAPQRVSMPEPALEVAAPDLGLEPSPRLDGAREPAPADQPRVDDTIELTPASGAAAPEKKPRARANRSRSN